MLALMGVFLLLLATHTSYIKMAISGPATTILGSISELLSTQECHELCLLLAITQKEAELSEERELIPSSQWQDISNMDQCKESLGHWLEMQKGFIDWDRLARALRQIGRPDVSRELKKSLNMNRSLEPKWNAEENQTGMAPKSHLVIEKRAPVRRSRQGPIQKPRKAFLKEKSWSWKTFFQKWLPSPLHRFTLQQYIGPATRLLLATFLAGLVLWLFSLYYIICWNLRQCLFANGVHYNGTPVRQNMNLTVIWNHQSEEDSSEDLDTSEDNEGAEEEY
ncbi:uncharacterized protein LOC120305442 [Crotalus tigris]|uniref:uncharacterized protein LOC120305442 n=1 Tax=Crotalus tigris TaxID=88082 RepID=UPI00192F3969|nr:uncharacterized protein LOC120305442 [Crotalus tigris]